MIDREVETYFEKREKLIKWLNENKDKPYKVNDSSVTGNVRNEDKNR